MLFVFGSLSNCEQSGIRKKHSLCLPCGKFSCTGYIVTSSPLQNIFFLNQLSKLEKQQQRKEKTRAKGPSESSKERNAPRKEDRSASSGAEGDVSSEREP